SRALLPCRLHSSLEAHRLRFAGRIETIAGCQSPWHKTVGCHLRAGYDGAASDAPAARSLLCDRVRAIDAPAGGSIPTGRENSRRTGRRRHRAGGDPSDWALFGRCVCDFDRQPKWKHESVGCIMKRLFRGFNAILYKEFIVVLRDPMTLFFMFFPPLIE